MKRTLIFLIFFFALLGLFAQQREDLIVVRRQSSIMGSTVEVTVLAENEEIGAIYIQEAFAEMQRIEKLISSYDPASTTSEINKNAGIAAVEVSREYLGFIERALEISELSSGYFDISSKALEVIWPLDGSMRYLPTSEEIAQYRQLCNFRNIVLDKVARTVYLKYPGMQIGFGGIGKGFAVDKAKALLLTNQVPGGMINAGGDISTWGSQLTGEKWLLGIPDPKVQSNVLQWIPLIESSASTSEAYKQFVSFKGRKFGHILNPLSGFSQPKLSKATVFTRSAELADALATALINMTAERGLRIINQLGDTEAILVDQEGLMYWSRGLLRESDEN